MEKTPLRIATYNLRNITDHYHLRLPLLKNVIDKMNFDIAGFQEVSFLEYNQLNDLFESDEYIQYNAQAQLNYKGLNLIEDEKFNIDGNSIVIKKGPKINSEGDVKFQLVHLSPVRNCCMLSIIYNGIKINIINTHLHHVVTEELIRLDQVKNILRWVELKTNQDDINIILGDLNTLPFSETYNYFINSGYISSYFHHHSHEPIKTFHNKMDAPYKDTDDEGTFDYIFIKQNKNSKYSFKIERIQIYGEEECELNKGIFASDHYGIVAEISFDLN